MGLGMEMEMEIGMGMYMDIWMGMGMEMENGRECGARDGDGDCELPRRRYGLQPNTLCLERFSACRLDNDHAHRQ